MLTQRTTPQRLSHPLTLPKVKPLAALRLSLALCYLWFGTLKTVPGLSPAEGLAELTVERLTFGVVSGPLAVGLLAVLEVVIGLMMLFGLRTRLALHLMLGHMLCTLAPMFLLPSLVFTHVPYGLTLVGQYIVKNTVFMSGAWLVLRSTDETHDA